MYNELRIEKREVEKSYHAYSLIDDSMDLETYCDTTIEMLFYEISTYIRKYYSNLKIVESNHNLNSLSNYKNYRLNSKTESYYYLKIEGNTNELFQRLNIEDYFDCPIDYEIIGKNNKEYYSRLNQKEIQDLIDQKLDRNETSDLDVLINLLN